MKSKYVIFRKNYRPPEDVLSYFDDDQVSPIRNKWTNLDASEVCLFIIEWKARSLFIHSNLHGSILKEISNVYFSNLTVLNVYKNNIDSTEILHRIYMPSLKQINIGGNQIATIKSIRKIGCPRFAVLDAYDNMISDACTLTELPAKSLK